MLITEFITKIEVAEQKIMSQLVDVSEAAALDLKALVVRRIQSDGVGEYSKKPLPVFFFTSKLGVDLSKTKSNAGVKFIEKAAKEVKEKKRKGITWAEIRDAEGLQTNHVDLTFTGEMFRDLHIIGTNVQRGKITTILGASRKETIDKLKWNAERYGSFLDPTPEERKLITSIIRKKTAAILKNILNE